MYLVSWQANPAICDLDFQSASACDRLWDLLQSRSILSQAASKARVRRLQDIDVVAMMCIFLPTSLALRCAYFDASERRHPATAVVVHT